MYNQIYGDSRRIMQLLINFISNSLKFTPVMGKVTIMLKINEEQLDTEKQCSQGSETCNKSKGLHKFISFEINIMDNGVGMSKEG